MVAVPSVSERRFKTLGPRVLCVDLDGTLVATDLLWECALSVLRTSPWMLLVAPLWLLQGRAYFKQRVAKAASIEFSTLPYRKDVLQFIDVEHRSGRTVVLATAADQALATGVARHLGVFSDVMASDGVTNLKGRAKADSLVNRFGSQNFDYIGDSRADIPIWNRAATAMTANPSWVGRVPGLRSVRTADREPLTKLRSLARAARPHQWVKNLLLFVPAFAAHRLDWPTQESLLFAFASLSLCASGGYILNDLLDVTADRQHPRKRSRPFAAGDLSPKAGVLLVAGIWSLGFGLAALLLPNAFLILAAGYLAATVAYSVRLKREPVLDVMFLASLYVVRVVAGGAATGIPVSTWLLAFTLFLCLSLAFLKRFIEVQAQSPSAPSGVPGRGYVAEDATWLHSVGISSAYLSAVVLAIYANGPDVTRLYGHAERLLLLCPILLYWATRTWLFAHRRIMHDDPIVAVSKDPVTYILAIACAVIVWAAV